MKKNVSILALSVISAIALQSATVRADGMDEPKRVKQVKPVISPLDKAVTQVEMKEPPVVMPAQTTTTTIETVEPTRAVAPENRVTEVQKENASFLGLSVGAFDVAREDDRSVMFGAEYQAGARILGVLQPILGVNVTTGSSVTGYGALGLPIYIGDNIQITPSLGVAAYHNGADYDLGQVINARGAAEIAYVFEDRSRIGVTGSILSNLDSFHDEDMVGTVALTYTTPTTLFSGK